MSYKEQHSNHYFACANQIFPQAHTHTHTLATHKKRDTGH